MLMRILRVDGFVRATDKSGVDEASEDDDANDNDDDAQTEKQHEHSQ